MGGFYLTLLATVFAGIGARDQVLVARLTLIQGARPLVLVIAVLGAIATAAFAAWAAMAIAPLLSPLARQFFMAMALVFAGVESIVIRPRAAPREPTLSLAALAFTVIAFQAIDAARFLVFAMAIASGQPWLAGLAGAVSGSLLVAAGWLAADAVAHPRLRLVRRAIGVVLLLIGAALAASVLIQR